MVTAVAVAASGCQVHRRAAPIGIGLLRVGEVVRATDRPALSPMVWSPDGGQFAYGSRDGVWVHHVGDATGRKIAPGEAVTILAWSPADGTLAYVDRGALWVVQSDGSLRRRIPIRGIAAGPTWAPGGDRLAFAVRTVGSGPAESQLWIAGPGGAEPQQIRWQLKGRHIGALGWFPDSLHLFVGLTSQDGEASVEWWQVRTAHLDSRRLPGPPFPVAEAVLSPTGEWVAFVAGSPGAERAYVVRRGGGGLAPISPAVRRLCGLAWSLHGDKLAYGLMRDEATAEIYATSVSRRTPALVASHRIGLPDPAVALSLAWSPDDARLAFGTNTGTHTGPVWFIRFLAR